MTGGMPLLATPSLANTPGIGCVTLDASGPWPALCVDDAARGFRVVLNGRRNPVQETARELARSLRGETPPIVVVVGLGLGYALDAIEHLGLDCRVLALEPLPGALTHFHARRDWSAWLDTGRLHIVQGPEYADVAEAWAALDPVGMPPVFVAPVMARACANLVAAARGALVRARRATPLDPQVPAVRRSMLHVNVLITLEHHAAVATGAVVEIGAYVGGATMAMARGIRDSGRDTPMFTIEPGGSYPTHPHLPSTDIFADLLENVRKDGLEEYVTLLNGHSSTPAIHERVRAELQACGQGIGLLCIDADGNVQRDFDLYLPFCSTGCLLAIDDYSGRSQNAKFGPTKEAVDRLVARGLAREIGVIGWGTWFGVYTP